MKWNGIENIDIQIDLIFTSTSLNDSKSWIIFRLPFSIAICNAVL